MAGKKIIFIIEKDKELLSMLDLVLNKEYTIYSFLKADDSFISLLEKLKPDLMILEWLSYSCNSDDIIERVRTRYKDSCKILIISTRQKVKTIIPEKNIDGFLMKPFRVNELRESIDNILNIHTEGFRRQ